MNYGIQKCIWTALGDITANLIQATLVIFVLGNFISDNPNKVRISGLRSYGESLHHSIADACLEFGYEAI